MNNPEIFNILSLLSELRSKIDVQAVDNVYIKNSLDKINQLIKDENEYFEEKITSIEERCSIIEEQNSQKYTIINLVLMPIWSTFLKYFTPIFFSCLVFCLYEGIKHLSEFKTLNFS